MKTLTVTLAIAFLIISNSCFSQWYWKSPFPQANNLRNIFIPGNNRLIGIGDFGTVISSTDNGTNWTIENKFFGISASYTSYFLMSESGAYIVSNQGKILKSTNMGGDWSDFAQIPGVSNVLSFCFTSVQIAYAVCDQRKVLKSTNGGHNWSVVYNAGSNLTINSSYFIDDTTGFITAGAFLFDPYILFKTTDGGITWNVIYQSNSYSVILKKFTDASTGFMIQSNTLMKSTDQGSTWNSLSPDYSQNCRDAFIFTNDSIISVHTNGTLRFTSNGATNWSSASIPEYANGIVFEDGNEGYMMGYNNRILFTSNRGSSWQYITEGNGSGSADNWIKSLEFIDQNTGFACGWNGYLRKTTDKGESWIPLQTGLPSHYYDTEFTDENVGYLLYGNSGETFLAKTTNAGNNFSQIYSFNEYATGKVEFLNSNTGFILGYYRFFRTGDAGLSWTETDLPDNIQLYGFDNIDNSTIFICGKLQSSSTSKVYKSTDAGLTWIEVFSASKDMYRITFCNNLTGYVCGRGMFKTTDGGSNWLRMNTLPGDPFLSGMDFLNANTGIVSGYGDVYRTTNGGEKWEINQNLPTGTRLENVHFFSKDTVLLTGDQGVILKTYNGGGNYITGFSEQKTERISSHELFQNYPNPFNPSTTIKFMVKNDVSGVAVIRIYNILGVEIDRLTIDLNGSGIYSVLWNADRFSSGAYFYSVDLGGEAMFSKMLLLK
jgi:photosystem II stability/assembly factor-like uncharacterized protein